jgi:hypothetical protein
MQNITFINHACNRLRGTIVYCGIDQGILMELGSSFSMQKTAVFFFAEHCVEKVGLLRR